MLVSPPFPVLLVNVLSKTAPGVIHEDRQTRTRHNTHTGAWAHGGIETPTLTLTLPWKPKP